MLDYTALNWEERTLFVRNKKRSTCLENSDHNVGTAQPSWSASCKLARPTVFDSVDA